MTADKQFIVRDSPEQDLVVVEMQTDVWAQVGLALAVLAEVERRLGAHDTLSFSRVGTPADKSKAAMLREILTLARARARVGEEE